MVRQLSERLVTLGHEVTIATRKLPERNFSELNGVKIVEFAIEGNSVYGIKGDATQYEKYLLTSDFDIITNFAAQQWATDLSLPMLSSLRGKKVFVPTGFSSFYHPDFASYFERMKSQMMHYDMNVFLSDNYRDINFARANGITKNIIIPNGAAADEFLTVDSDNIRKQLGISDNTFLILHIGSYTTYKGHIEAVKIYLKSDLKRSSTLVLIGNDNHKFAKYLQTRLNIFRYKLPLLLARLKGKRLLIRELDRKSTVALLKSADLFFFPSNIECSPIVLFESMASGTAFLTTDVGNAGEIIQWSGGGALMPTNKNERSLSFADIEASAKVLEDLVADPERLEKLGKSGFEAWSKKFSWEIITKKYEQLYSDLLKQS